MSNNETKEDFLEEMLLREPGATYSYADYLRRTFEERVELLKRKLFKFSVPKTRHLQIPSHVFSDFGIFLKHRPCEASLLVKRLFFIYPLYLKHNSQILHS